MSLLPLKTRDSLKAYLVDFPPSSARAQLINIIGYKLEEGQTIAEKFISDHVDLASASRQAMLLVQAGCAELKEIKKQVHCGHNVFKEKVIVTVIIFEDGSEL